jgi:hypothetical protein
MHLAVKSWAGNGGSRKTGGSRYLYIFYRLLHVTTSDTRTETVQRAKKHDITTRPKGTVYVVYTQNHPSHASLPLPSGPDTRSCDLTHTHLLRPLLRLFVLLLLRLLLLNPLTVLLPLQLIRSSNRNILRLVIAKEVLESLLNDIASNEITRHNNGDHKLEVAGKRNEFELLVDLGDKLGCAGECHGGHGDQAPVHALVLADGFAEGAALVVDCEGGDLLDELQEVDCGVQKGGLEVLLQVWVGVLGLDALHVLRDVDERDNVDSELTEDRADDVDVEDVVLGSLLGEGLDGLGELA